MGGLETALIVLGTAVAKTACGIWLGESRLANEIGNSAIDQAVARLTGTREKRQFRRFWDQAAENIGAHLEPLIDVEFRDLPENEKLAAIDAVRLTFEKAALTEADLFKLDLDAGFLDRHLRTGDPERPVIAGLSAAATSLYDLLLRECCAYAIELVRTIPGADVTGIAELLRRDRQILEQLETALARLPVRRGVVDFERDYRQLVANRLDRVELFGATLGDTSRNYPLSVAYLSLTVSGDFPAPPPPPVDEMTRIVGRLIDTMQDRPEPALAGGTGRVEEVLALARRVFVRGQAGIGKTTLLQWIAVQSARGDFTGRIREWNGTVPFFLPLRRYAQRDLPAPEEFLTQVGRYIAEEMPDGWVQRQLRAGTGIVLVDGVDELPEERRADVRRWLAELIASFPDARYVVTTRPAAAPADWLRAEEFVVAELEPMTPTDVPVFVRRWHEAMREQCPDTEQRDRLTEYENRLLDGLATHRHLRRLAGYPLLCALLCALHRDRRGELPANRMELYRDALQMLLDRRDRERQLATSPALSQTEKTLLLRDIAYWLIRNEWSSAPADRVRERVAAKLPGMAVRADPDQVYRALLERSGLLREPVEGQVDFVHRSFQEYLAGEEAAASSGADDIGVLIRNAHHDSWHEVVVLAAGHATLDRRVELLTGILKRAREEPGQTADTLRLVALACLDTSPELPPELRKRIRAEASPMIPPANMSAAQAVAKAGDFALDLLIRAEPPRAAASVAATIRAAADIADPAALPLLAKFGTDRRKAVVKELYRAWPRFDPDEYARTVLPAWPLDPDEWFEVTHSRFASALRHLSNLRRLRYAPTDVAVADLGFLAQLPELEDLYVERVSDLGPVAMTSLRSLSCHPPMLDHEPLSLAPLVNMPALEYLDVDQPVTDLGVLRTLPSLTSLRLAFMPESARLSELRELTGLTSVGVGGMPDLTDLRPLSWLTELQTLWLEDCPLLTDLTHLDNWRDSLRALSLIRCGTLDLASLGSLRLLDFLQIVGTSKVDIESIPELPALTKFSVRFRKHALPWLSFPNRLPALEEARILGVEVVDVGPLVGRRVTISVSAGTEVLGAEEFRAHGGTLKKL